MAVLSLYYWAGFSLVLMSRRLLSSYGTQASHCSGFSCGRAQALGHRIGSYGTWAELLQGMLDLPRPGIQPMSPALAGGFFTPEPPGKPLSWSFDSQALCFSRASSSRPSSRWVFSFKSSIICFWSSPPLFWDAIQMFFNFSHLTLKGFWHIVKGPCPPLKNILSPWSKVYRTPFSAIFLESLLCPLVKTCSVFIGHVCC